MLYLLRYALAAVWGMSSPGDGPPPTLGDLSATGQGKVGQLVGMVPPGDGHPLMVGHTTPRVSAFRYCKGKDFG